MKIPWANKTGVAKLIAIFASLLGIAAGLCGANFVVVTVFASFGGDANQGTHTVLQRIQDAIYLILIYAGLLELAVIVISLIALFVLAIVASVRRAGKSDFPVARSVQNNGQSSTPARGTTRRTHERTKPLLIKRRSGPKEVYAI